jgi:hypothetical protein
MSSKLIGTFKPETNVTRHSLECESASSYCKEVIYFSGAAGKVGIDLVHMFSIVNHLQMLARTAEYDQKVKQV